MKKRVVLTILFLLSLSPMLLYQFGHGRGIVEISGWLNLFSPIGIVSTLLFTIGIWGNFKNKRLNKNFGAIGVIGIVIGEIYNFLTWHYWYYTGNIGLKYSLDWVFPEFYFGLSISIIMVFCYFVISELEIK